MMESKLHLNMKEINEIYEMGQTIYEDKDPIFSPITLSCEQSSVGHILSATFEIEHKGLPGEFTVAITDVRDW